MRKFVRATLSLGVMVALVVLTTLAERTQAADAKKKTPDGTKNPVFEIPKEITLTSEQQTKLDDIKKENGPKLVELNAKLEDTLTDEQKSARKEAIAKVTADKTTGKARAAAINEALNLTDDQKKIQQEIEPELAKLRLSIKTQIHGLLTDEQKTYFKLPSSKPKS